MKFSEMDANTKMNAIIELTQVKNDLFKIYQYCSEQVTKSLFLVNSGGIITLLAFIHSNPSLKNHGLTLALFSFICGLISDFTLVIYDYFVILSKSNQFKTDLEKFYNNYIPLTEIKLLLEKRKFSWVVLMGIASGLFAVIGIIISLYLLMYFV